MIEELFLGNATDCAIKSLSRYWVSYLPSLQHMFLIFDVCEGS